MTSLTELLNSNLFVVTEITIFQDNTMRIKAQKRQKEADESSFVSKYYSLSYANKICKEVRGENIKKAFEQLYEID